MAARRKRQFRDGFATLSFHSVGAVSGQVNLLCHAIGAGLSNPTHVYISKRRLTALRIGGSVNVQ